MNDNYWHDKANACTRNGVPAIQWFITPVSRAVYCKTRLGFRDTDRFYDRNKRQAEQTNKRFLTSVKTLSSMPALTPQPRLGPKGPGTWFWERPKYSTLWSSCDLTWFALIAMFCDLVVTESSHDIPTFLQQHNYRCKQKQIWREIFTIWHIHLLASTLTKCARTITSSTVSKNDFTTAVRHWKNIYSNRTARLNWILNSITHRTSKDGVRLQNRRITVCATGDHHFRNQREIIHRWTVGFSSRTARKKGLLRPLRPVTHAACLQPDWPHAVKRGSRGSCWSPQLFALIPTSGLDWHATLPRAMAGGLRLNSP